MNDPSDAGAPAPKQPPPLVLTAPPGPPPPAERHGPDLIVQSLLVKLLALLPAESQPREATMRAFTKQCLAPHGAILARLEVAVRRGSPVEAVLVAAGAKPKERPQLIDPLSCYEDESEGRASFGKNNPAPVVMRYRYWTLSLVTIGKRQKAMQRALLRHGQVGSGQ